MNGQATTEYASKGGTTLVEKPFINQEVTEIYYVANFDRQNKNGNEEVN